MAVRTHSTDTAAPVRRHVEHVMGMPISLALRGRHAGDARGAAAWADAMTVLREADRMFSTYRTDSVIFRLCGGQVALAECPPEVAAQVREILALGDAAERDSGGAFALSRDGVLDPSGVVKGWAAERAAAHLAALPHTDFCLSAGGDITCRTLDPSAPPGASGSRTRTTRAGSSPSCRSTPAPSPRPVPRTAGPTSSTPAPDVRPSTSPP
jgi:FAD:protein FMN transferase